MRGKTPKLSGEALQKLREWRATPRGKRRRSLTGMAALLGISRTTASRAAYGMGCYRVGD